MDGLPVVVDLSYLISNTKNNYIRKKKVNMPNAIVRLVFVIQSNQYARSIAVYFGFPNPPGRMFESTQKLSNEFLKHLINLSYLIRITKNNYICKKKVNMPNAIARLVFVIHKN